MHCFLFQNWITLRAQNASTSSPASVTQSEPGWLDLTPYQDVVAWLQVSEVVGPASATSLYIDFQTAPAKDESYFCSLVNQLGQATSGIALSAASSPTVQRFMHDGAYTPLSKWLRWKVSTNGVNAAQTWEVTFRIWLAASYAVRHHHIDWQACGCSGG
jgi:hypothetical protein